MSVVAALDVGGTRLKAALVESGAVTSEVLARSTAGLSGSEVVALIRETVAELRGLGDIGTVAVAMPGICDGRRVVVLPGKFAGIAGVDLAAELGDAARVLVVNDAIAAGVGEARFGAGAAYGRIVMVTIGTGVGTAAVEHGEPLGSGPWGGGSLAGQIPIAPPDNGPRDTNGVAGTIEARCAAQRLIDAARAAGSSASTVADLIDAWHARESAAREAVAAYRRDLEPALVALTQAYAPSALVIGGGPVATSADWLLDGLADAVNARLWPGQRVDLVPAALGDAAALVGAAALANG